MTPDAQSEATRRRLLVAGMVLAPLMLAQGVPRRAAAPRADWPALAMNLKVGDVLNLQARLPMPAWY